MKKLLSLIAMLALCSGVFAQVADPTPAPIPTGVVPAPIPTPIPTPIPLNPLDDPKIKDEIAKTVAALLQKAEDDKKKSPEQLNLEKFELEKQAFADQQTAFNKQKNELSAQSYMLDPKVGLSKELLPFIGITAELDEAGVKNKVDGFKAAIDQHIKSIGMVSTNKHIVTSSGGTGKTAEEIAAEILGTKTATNQAWGQPRT